MTLVSWLRSMFGENSLDQKDYHDPMGVSVADPYSGFDQGEDLGNGVCSLYLAPQHCVVQGKSRLCCRPGISLIRCQKVFQSLFLLGISNEDKQRSYPNHSASQLHWEHKYYFIILKSTLGLLQSIGSESMSTAGNGSAWRRAMAWCRSKSRKGIQELQRRNTGGL